MSLWQRYIIDWWKNKLQEDNDNDHQITVNINSLISYLTSPQYKSSSIIKLMVSQFQVSALVTVMSWIANKQTSEVYGLKNGKIWP